jgi:4-nitrophenyl phosphatase
LNETSLERLRSARGFVFDLDGTLARGDARNEGLKAEPGAAELLNLLTDRGTPWLIFTNGTLRLAEAYVPKLQAMGFPMTAERMLTPSYVAADALQRLGHKRIMAMGCEGVWRPLADAGLEVVLSSQPDPGPVDAIYVGWYREFGMEDIEAGVEAIEGGAKLYSASGTPFFATSRGRAPGTSVVICAALEALTGCETVVLGKPSVYSLECAARRLGLAPEELVIVGDDPRLEVHMAHMGGAVGVYVHSGTGGAEAFANADPKDRPDFDLTGAGELLRLLQFSGH